VSTIAKVLAKVEALLCRGWKQAVLHPGNEAGHRPARTDATASDDKGQQHAYSDEYPGRDRGPTCAELHILLRSADQFGVFRTLDISNLQAG
jgi:hypothetical protein